MYVCVQHLHPYVHELHICTAKQRRFLETRKICICLIPFAFSCTEISCTPAIEAQLVAWENAVVDIFARRGNSK
jgi:hypothetical protein